MSAYPRKTICFFLAIVLACFPAAESYGMQSANYVIPKDSINFTGTDDSASASYRLSDTGGEIGSGPGGSASYALNAGYRQADAAAASYTISISSPADAALSPDIGGLSGGVGDGSVTWKVITDNPSGYQLDIRAGTSPALRAGAYSFADYVPYGADPDFEWSVAAAASEFGYSVEGTHTVSKLLDNGSACGLGSGNTASKCWLGLSTGNASIATSALPNSPTGTDTLVKFRAEAGNQRMQENGSYSATIVVTAVAL